MNSFVNSRERMNGMNSVNKTARMNVNSGGLYIHSSEQYVYRDRFSESRHVNQLPVQRDCSLFTDTPPVHLVHIVHAVHAFITRFKDGRAGYGGFLENAGPSQHSNFSRVGKAAGNRYTRRPKNRLTG